MTYAKTEQHSCLEALRDFPSVRSATPCHVTPCHAMPFRLSFRFACFALGAMQAFVRGRGLLV
jgi:hypothetical protein